MILAHQRHGMIGSTSEMINFGEIFILIKWRLALQFLFHVQSLLPDKRSLIHFEVTNKVTDHHEATMDIELYATTLADNLLCSERYTPRGSELNLNLHCRCRWCIITRSINKQSILPAYFNESTFRSNNSCSVTRWWSAMNSDLMPMFGKLSKRQRMELRMEKVWVNALGVSIHHHNYQAQRQVKKKSWEYKPMNE